MLGARRNSCVTVGHDAYESNPNAKSIAGVKLGDYLNDFNKFIYVYDFGDYWQHYFTIENVIGDCDDQLPLLLSGESDSPPEDVGGPSGYAHFLAAIADPKHMDFEDLAEWAKSQRWQRFDFDSVARRVRST